MIDLNALGVQHSAWVERMGWHNTTVLERMALIASEIGEATFECQGICVRDRFGEELADVILRCVDLAHTERIDLNSQVAKALMNLEWFGETLEQQMAEVFIEWSKWCNTARKAVLGAEFSDGMGVFVARVINVAGSHHIDLSRAIQLKLKKNAINGTRGRTF